MDIHTTFRKSAIAVAVLCSLGLPLTSVASVNDSQLIQQHDANTWLEINAGHFENNLNILQTNVIKNKAAVCAVLKADAYGHGISLLIPSVIKLGINRICIANNSEARIARQRGFEGDIIRIRIAGEKEIEEGISLGIEEMAGSLELMQTLSRLGKKHKRTMKVHFNINSAGMSRNGLEIDTESGKRDAQKILKLPNIQFTGLMTHYPDENVEGVTTGLNQFKKDVDWIIKTGRLNRKDLVVHCANTYATTHVSDSHLDMVRVGSLLYGMGASHIEGLKPVMSMKTRVGSIQQYKKGDTVVYDRTFTLQRDSQLANLPVGYSDGYNRSFSNRTQVLINGRRYPVVGKITMNTVMVDVTGGNVKPGDEVVLLGEQDKAHIPMSELMAASYTFYGEFFMNIGYSNPKLLVK